MQLQSSSHVRKYLIINSGSPDFITLRAMFTTGMNNIVKESFCLCLKWGISYKINRKINRKQIVKLKALADPRRGPGTRPHPNSFIFMQFLAKILPNNRFLPVPRGLAPLLGNPRSATEKKLLSFVIV